MSSTSLVVSSPDSQAPDEIQTASLWAAVDYTEMCQSLDSSYSLAGYDVASLENDLQFDGNVIGGPAHLDHLPSQMPPLSEQSPFPNLSFDGMSPMASFFGSSSLNFGG